ncbi:unnamed protein product, partial [Polarella glacialis]
LDSTVLAALAAEALPDGETVELLNVAFDKAAPDRLTALCSYEDLLARFGPDRFRLILCDVQESEVRDNELAICRLLGPQATHLDFNIAAALWFASRGEGHVCSPAFHEQPWWAAARADEASVSAVQLEPLKPIEAPGAPEPVPAEKVRCVACVLPAKPGCPHLTCKLCCRKLRQAAGDPDGWCKVHKVKAPKHEGAGAEEEQDGKATAAAPELDLSALRCSASGGAVPEKPVRAASRVLLVGTGADELLGGYSRHKTARVKRGADGTRSEMLKDLHRLWSRNLGRDDRIIADHGREARHPFLDDGVLRFVGSLPIELLAYGPGGDGDPSPDKWMLREMAAARGLGACSLFKKRAIQFGSRIAKQSNIWHAGSNRQVRGDMAYCALAEDDGTG